MKKILVLINDYKVPATALNFALKLAVLNEATLFGIFAHIFLAFTKIYPFTLYLSYQRMCWD